MPKMSDLSHHDEIWTTHDGRKIPVSEMSEDHVRNALRMVIRRQRKLAIELIDDPEDIAYYESEDNHAPCDRDSWGSLS